MVLEAADGSPHTCLGTGVVGRLSLGPRTLLCWARCVCSGGEVKEEEVGTAKKEESFTSLPVSPDWPQGQEDTSLPAPTSLVTLWAFLIPVSQRFLCSDVECDLSQLLHGWQLGSGDEDEDASKTPIPKNTTSSEVKCLPWGLIERHPNWSCHPHASGRHSPSPFLEEGWSLVGGRGAGRSLRGQSREQC